MSKELARRKRLQPQEPHQGVDAVDIPTSPVSVFALVVDYTAMTMEDLENVRTLIGGGNGPVVKLNPALLGSDQTHEESLDLLIRVLIGYPCQMLFLLVPWGMPRVEEVIAFMTEVSQRPLVVFAIGRRLYSVEMSLTIDPLSEGDAELRQDPEANDPELQWVVRQPWKDGRPAFPPGADLTVERHD